MDLVKSISPRQTLNSFIWIVCRNAQCELWSDRAGMLSVRTPTDYRCIFLTNRGDNLNEEEYSYK